MSAMTMPASTCSWKKFVLSNDVPFPIGSESFFKFLKTENGLVLHVTDLTRLWTATKTTREDLCEQALKIESPIDPSEDEDQYNVLISKLERSISGQNGASIRVICGGTPTGYLSKFEIETSIPLPSGLGTLEWEFSMIRQGAESLTHEVLFPSLCGNHEGKRREDDLLRLIREKDHAVSRLMDKIESAGINLAMVFPGFSGTRKRLNATQAAKVVPGLGPFDASQWTDRYQKSGGDNFTEILQSLTDDVSGDLVWKGPKENGSMLDEEQAILDRGRVSSEHVNGRTKRPNSSSSSDSDRRHAPKPQKAKLGMIGRSKAKGALRVESQLSPRSKLSQSTHSPENFTGHEFPSKPTPSRAKPKFGNIGGLKTLPKRPDTQGHRARTSPSPALSDTTATASISSQDSTTKRSKEDVGAGSFGPDDLEVEAEEEKEVKEEPPLTEEERANLKRKQLRAQLKAKGTDKKKRRF